MNAFYWCKTEQVRVVVHETRTRLIYETRTRLIYETLKRLIYETRTRLIYERFVFVQDRADEG